MAEKLQLTIEVDDKGSIKIKQFSDESKKAFDEMQKGPKAAQGPLDSLKESWVALAAKVAIATAAFYAAKRMIYDTARQIASATNDIERNASVVGLSITEYQKWAYAVKMADASTEGFITGIKFLSRNIEDSNRGVGDAKKYFDALGIKGKTTAEVMLELADRFKEAGNSGEQAARKIDYAMAVAGRGGMELIPLWNLGREGIKKYMDEAVKLGTVLGDVVVKKGSEAENTFKRLEAQINATKLSLAPAALEFAKAIGWIVDDLKKLFTMEPPLWLKTLWGLSPPNQPGIVKGWLRDLDERIGLTEYLIALEKKLGIQKETPYRRITDPKDTTIGKIKPLPAIADKDLGKELELSTHWTIALWQAEDKYNEESRQTADLIERKEAAILRNTQAQEGWIDLLQSSMGLLSDLTLEQIKLIQALQEMDEWIDQLGGAWGDAALKALLYEQASEEAIDANQMAIPELLKTTSDLQAIWESVGQNLSSAWSANLTNIVRSAESASEKIKSFFQSIGDVFLSAVSKMTTQWLIFGSITGEKKEGGGALTGGLWSGLLGSILKFKEGGIVPGWKPIQAFQHGGLITRPTLGMIGEGGPEAVIPLKGGKIPVEGGGKGDTYITYIQATDVDSFTKLYGPVIESVVYQGKRYNKMLQRR